jgi:23S rRNA (guanosine2251-2'-O)-methyltransferase
MYTSSFLPKRENNQLVFGIRAVIEAIKSGQEMESIYIQRGLRGELFHELRELMNEYQLSAQLVPVEKLNRLTAKNHQGVVAFISPITYQQIEDIIPAIYEKGETPLILVLDGVTDPHNLGACLRTADAAGVHAVVAPRDRAVGLNTTVQRVACGAAESVPYLMVTNLARTMRELKDRDLWLVGTDDTATQSIHQTDGKRSMAWVMGAEGEGMRRLTRETCDELVTIPMLGSVESLNVSVATAVCLYETVRQRQS